MKRIPDNCSNHSWQAVITMTDFALAVTGNADEITQLEFIAKTTEHIPRQPLAQEAARQLHLYRTHPHHKFTLPLAATGTPFQQRVWAQIAAIPSGETSSYGTLAHNIASSARAVGNACAANPYPIVIPCHRVIAAHGGLGGFAGQRTGFLLDIKHQLLAHESQHRR